MKTGWSRVPVARAPWVGLVLAAAIVGAGPVVGQSIGYRVQPGDVIGVLIAGLQDSPLQAPVQLDGQVTFPFIGGLDTTGKTIAELQVRIQSAFASRVIPVYTADGRELMRTFGRDQVTASVAEYRPIFVSGDVAQQGEFAFRPGLTVRQAVAAAGGAAYTGAQTVPSLDPLTLRADYLRAWYSVAATEARLWRLRSELGDNEQFEPALPPAPGSEATLERFTRLETELRDARALDHQRERTFLMQSLEQIDAQADVLGRQLEAETESAEVDAENLAAATATDSEALYTRSRQARLGDITQITNIRGAALMSATRRLQTEASLMQLQRRRTEVARELERLEDRRRMDLLAEISTTEVELADRRALFDDVYEKLQIGGLAAIVTGHARLVPSVTIVRATGRRPFRACMDDSLQPGDVVQVLLGDPARDTAPDIRTNASEACPDTSALDPRIVGQ